MVSSRWIPSAIGFVVPVSVVSETSTSSRRISKPLELTLFNLRIGVCGPFNVWTIADTTTFQSPGNGGSMLTRVRNALGSMVFPMPLSFKVPALILSTLLLIIHLLFVELSIVKRFSGVKRLKPILPTHRVLLNVPNDHR